MVPDDHVRDAFHVFTRQPMKFKVQTKIDHHLLAEEIAMVWCKDVEPKGCWNTTLEYMRKSMARCYYPDENYKF